MTIAAQREVVQRHVGNPLITLDDLSFQCIDICNAGVVRHDGQVVLLLTVESLAGRTGILLARSGDGVSFQLSDGPLIIPRMGDCGRPCECIGTRDPRVTVLEEMYYITYLVEGDCGYRLALAKTDDFKKIQRMGIISEPDVKNGCLFPERINGQFALLSRPSAGHSIWLWLSDDLTHWRPAGVVMAPRGGYWDAHRIGAAAPPILIDEGWLLIYYGIKAASAGPLTRLGAALLDRRNPKRVLARSDIPILTPREKYERMGDIPNLVFSCGALLEGGLVNIYYGASDSCLCLGSAPLADILDVLKLHQPAVSTAGREGGPA